MGAGTRCLLGVRQTACRSPCSFWSGAELRRRAAHRADARSGAQAM